MRRSIVPPRATAVLSATAETEPTQRDRHLQCIAEKGRMGWQKMSGYNARSRVEAAIGRYNTNRQMSFDSHVIFVGSWDLPGIPGDRQSHYDNHTPRVGVDPSVLVVPAADNGAPGAAAVPPDDSSNPFQSAP